MNYVDDDLIAAAHAPRKRLRHNLPTLAAACLVVAIIAAFPSMRSVVGGMDKAEDAPGNAMPAETDNPNFLIPSQNAPEESPDPYRELVFGGTAIRMTGWTDTTVSFVMKKTDLTPVYAAFLQNSGAVLGTSEPDFRDNGTIIRQYVVRVYVDGGPLQYHLPEAPGEYEVVVDFSSIRRMDYVMGEGVMLYAYTGEGGRRTDEWIMFYDPYERDTETESE